MIRRHFINNNDDSNNIIIYTTLNSNIFNMELIQWFYLNLIREWVGIEVPIYPEIISNIYDEYGVIKFNAPITTIGHSLTSIGPMFADSFGVLSDEENQLATVTLPTSVRTIENQAFSNCQTLDTVFLPEGLVSIGDEVFSGCTALTSIDIPNSVTSIGNDVFKECYSLKSITIGSGVVNLPDGLFNDCSALESITLGDNVEDFTSGLFSSTAFYKNESNWHEGVLYINNHLIDVKTNISVYTMPNNIINMSKQAFQDCTSLKSIVLSNNLRKIPSSAFGYCKSLTSITIPNSVTSIGEEAFHSCNALTSVTIPLSVVSIGKHGFSYSSKLNSINFNGTSNLWLLITKGDYWNNGIAAKVVHCTDGDVTL